MASTTFSVALRGLVLPLAFAFGAAAHAAPFTPSADGTQIKDEATGLTWRRCAEGMSWNGVTCSGTALKFSWTAALDRAKAAGQNWRLPNAKELASLVDTTRIEPAINPVFANTPVYWFWTGTGSWGTTNRSWFVEFERGAVGEDTTGALYNVRLVKSVKAS